LTLVEKAQDALPDLELAGNPHGGVAEHPLVKLPRRAPPLAAVSDLLDN
jgi:hypothetical protein